LLINVAWYKQDSLALYSKDSPMRATDQFVLY